MITIDEACRHVMLGHPNEYIHCINEHEKVYAFVLPNIGERITDRSIMHEFSTVNKTTGKVETTSCLNELVIGDYKRIEIPKEFRGIPPTGGDDL